MVATLDGSKGNWAACACCDGSGLPAASMVSAAIEQSALTCPLCGHSKLETMPTGACQFFHECEHCHAVLRPKPGDCCVYCSYGSVPCPSRQKQAKCAVALGVATCVTDTRLARAGLAALTPSP